MKGVVISVRRDKGFGFLIGDDEKTRFFHARSVSPPENFDLLKPNSKVIFESVTLPNAEGKGNGLRAIDVKLDATTD